ncbi:MAG: acetyl-CoA carboxylase biotin carboxyl carrier protein [Clostridium sp.]|nr:acetyl-CoA carboxylase biotin carboxyl carrier protein [Clostridium sp.]
MDFNGIKELIESVNSSDIAYFEYETNDGHIKMDKSLTRSLTEAPSKEIVKNEVKSEEVVKAKTESFSNNENVISQPVSQEKTKVSEDENLYIVKSPMVGTFYSSPSPDKAPFVSVGDTVKTSSILCIIEAMKLMNEIESEVSGTIKEILVKDGEMVEYGQPLFKIKED